MKILIAADLVPTESNINEFCTGNTSIIDKGILDLLEKSDFSIINLECPLTDSNVRIKKCGPILGAPTKTINLISKLKPSLLCLANNHIFDYGLKGLRDTLTILDNTNINHIGAGIIPGQEKVPFISDEIGVLNYCEHEFSFDEATMVGANELRNAHPYLDIQSLRKEGRRVLVIFHGGTENFRYPSPKLIDLCRSFIDFGADLVVCQHSHCVGTHEVYKDRHIVYGQGNFLFDFPNVGELWSTSLLLIYDTNKNSLDFIPIKPSGNGVSLDNDAGELTLEQFYARSKLSKDKFELDKLYRNKAKLEHYKYLCKLRGYSKIRTGIEVIIFKGFFLRIIFSKKRLRVLRDIIGCEAHNELMLKGISDKLK